MPLPQLSWRPVFPNADGSRPVPPRRVTEVAAVAGSSGPLMQYEIPLVLKGGVMSTRARNHHVLPEANEVEDKVGTYETPKSTPIESV